jgi:hypothetical protein
VPAPRSATPPTPPPPPPDAPGNPPDHPRRHAEPRTATPIRGGRTPPRAPEVPADHATKRPADAARTTAKCPRPRRSAAPAPSDTRHLTRECPPKPAPALRPGMRDAMSAPRGLRAPVPRATAPLRTAGPPMAGSTPACPVPGRPVRPGGGTDRKARTTPGTAPETGAGTAADRQRAPPGPAPPIPGARPPATGAAQPGHPERPPAALSRGSAPPEPWGPHRLREFAPYRSQGAPTAGAGRTQAQPTIGKRGRPGPHRQQYAGTWPPGTRPARVGAATRTGRRAREDPPQAAAVVDRCDRQPPEAKESTAVAWLDRRCSGRSHRRSLRAQALCRRPRATARSRGRHGLEAARAGLRSGGRRGASSRAALVSRRCRA